VHAGQQTPTRARPSAGSTRPTGGTGVPIAPGAAGRPGTAHERARSVRRARSQRRSEALTSPLRDGTAAKPSRFTTRAVEHTAWHPAKAAVDLSATHDASAIATTASAAVPASARISAPTPAVAGWPAATPGLIAPSYKLSRS
jgi:hypothetical protein